MPALNETEFYEFLDKMNKLTPEQLEDMFVNLHQNFRSNGGKAMNYAALAWR